MHRRETPGLIDQYVDIRTDRSAHRLDHGDCTLFVLFRDPAAPWCRQRVELKRGEPLRDDLFGGARVIGRRLHLITPAIRVDANIVEATYAE